MPGTLSAERHDATGTGERPGRSVGRLRRSRRAWRWYVMAMVVALLASLPAVVRAFPVQAPSVDPVALRSRILASTEVAYQGNVETRGGFRLPSTRELDEVAALFGETSRLRVWVRSPDRWRVDRITLTGEEDMYRGVYDDRFAALGGIAPAGPRGQEMVLTWSSERNDIDTFVGGDLLRVPRPFDLLPPELGRRLVRASSVSEVRDLAPARVAGRAVPGLRITPRSDRSLVAHADVWADPTSGLPLRVRVVAKGDTHPALEASFLELSLAAPTEAQVTFDTTTEVLAYNAERFRFREIFRGPELDTLLAVLPSVALPDAVGSLDSRARLGEAARSYGDGFDLVGVVVTPGFVLGRDLSAVPTSERPWGLTVALVRTPLFNAMLFFHAGNAYLVGGTVDLPTLDAAAAEVAAGAGITVTLTSEGAA